MRIRDSMVVCERNPTFLEIPWACPCIAFKKSGFCKHAVVLNKLENRWQLAPSLVKLAVQAKRKPGRPRNLLPALAGGGAGGGGAAADGAVEDDGEDDENGPDAQSDDEIADSDVEGE